MQYFTDKQGRLLRRCIAVSLLAFIGQFVAISLHASTMVMADIAAPQTLNPPCHEGPKLEPGDAHNSELVGCCDGDCSKLKCHVLHALVNTRESTYVVSLHNHPPCSRVSSPSKPCISLFRPPIFA